MPPNTCFKRLHHTACTTAVNSKYESTYTVDQVQRHWRRHKDTWGLVAKHMNESGGGWDESTKMVTVSQATLKELQPNDLGILSKPIQFFDKLQELFSGSTTDGSFMQDPSTATDPDQDDTAVHDMANYDKADDPHGQDPDKLESDSDDCQEVAALTATSSQVSSSSVKSIKVKKTNFKRFGKSNALPPTARDRARKSNTKPSPACASDDTDVELTNTLKSIERNLAKPVQVAPPPDPNAPLWDMLRKIALTPEDRLTAGLHLCKTQFQVQRSFLINMGQEYLERRVLKYSSGDDAGNE
ncbi:hypothetical protein BS78_10G124900 [Paspalum vaginatum]|nr:hypothetical protein BS78_10G124900 [Paspalum vaginatum]